jgi:hypothetical protein
MPEDTPLPLARMVSINKPSFWIFMGACLALYVSNKVLAPDTLDGSVIWTNDFIIMCVAFAGLLLNMVTVFIKDETLNHVFSIGSYIFEAAGIIVLAFLVFAS